MKKSILISLAMAGGAALAAGVVYVARKLRDAEYCDDCDDCDGCEGCGGCDCYVDGSEDVEESAEIDEEATESADDEEGH